MSLLDHSQTLVRILFTELSELRTPMMPVQPRLRVRWSVPVLVHVSIQRKPYLPYDFAQGLHRREGAMSPQLFEYQGRAVSLDDRVIGIHVVQLLDTISVHFWLDHNSGDREI